MDRRVTIQEVADRAGVSPSTVSRALRDNPRISEVTKRKVRDAVDELGYRGGPNVGQATGAQMLAVILPAATPDFIRHPFFASVLHGISHEAQEAGYYPSYAYAVTEEKRIDTVKEYLKTLSVRGFILLAAFAEDRSVDFLLDAGSNLCVIGRPGRADRVPWVDNDNFHAAYDAASVLIDHGARKLAFLGGPARMNVTRDRFEGFRMALSNRGITSHDHLVGYAREFSELGGLEAMNHILSADAPDALLASDDFLAMGARKALAEHNLPLVPCIGFNNTKWGTETGPPFSSVEIFPEELGRHAARLVIAAVENRATAEFHTIVPTKLVRRGSLLSGADTNAS